MESEEIFHAAQKYFRSVTNNQRHNTKVYKMELWHDNENNVYPLNLHSDRKNNLYAMLLHWKTKGIETSVDDLIRICFYCKSSYSELELLHEENSNKYYLHFPIGDMLRSDCSNMRMYIDLQTGAFSLTLEGYTPLSKVQIMSEKCCYFDPVECREKSPKKFDNFEKLSNGFSGVYKHLCGVIFYLIQAYITQVSMRMDDKWVIDEISKVRRYLITSDTLDTPRFLTAYEPDENYFNNRPVVTYPRSMDDIMHMDDGGAC